MNQNQLHATLSALIAERAHAGESLAAVGAVLAQLTDPLEAKRRAPLGRQYVQMLAVGKARIIEPLAQAILTLAAMQDGVAEVQARAHRVTTPLYSLHDLPPNAIITDPAHKCRLDGYRVQIIGRRAYCGPDCRRAAARQRRAADKARSPQQ